MQRVRSCTVSSIDTLIDLLTMARINIAQSVGNDDLDGDEVAKFYSNCRLIIIDSLTMPFLNSMTTVPNLGRILFNFIIIIWMFN